MFAGYNKFDDAKVRIGSWREELALKELTGVTRLADPGNKAVFNGTGVRWAEGYSTGINNVVLIPLVVSMDALPTM